MSHVEKRIRALERRIIPPPPPPPQSDEEYLQDIQEALYEMKQRFSPTRPKNVTLAEENKREILKRRKRLEKCSTLEERWRVFFPEEA